MADINISLAGAGIPRSGQPARDVSLSGAEPLVSCEDASDDAHGVGNVSSIPSAVFMLCCMSLGVGVFTMASVLNSVGWPTGVALIIFFGVLSTVMMLLVLDVADDRGCQNSDEFASLVPGCWFVSLVGMCLSPMIANAAHFQLVSGMLFDLMEWFVTKDYGEYSYGTIQKAVLLVIFVCIALPWTFMDNLGSLRHVGKLVAGTIISTSVVVSVCALARVANHEGASGDQVTPAGLPSIKSLITAAPTVCFAFSGMFNLYDINGAMRRARPKDALPRMRRVVIWAGVLITTLYLIVAVTCVWAFGKQAGKTTKGNGSGNTLYNFPPENYFVTVLCVALCAAIILDYPIINFPLVGTVLRLDFAFNKSAYARQTLSVIFAVLVILIDVIVPDLDDVFGLCGALGMSNFCYIVPGFVVLFRSRSFPARVVGIVAILMGLGMLFVSTFFIIQGIIAQKQ